jgi:hypothetical protein
MLLNWSNVLGDCDTSGRSKFSSDEEMSVLLSTDSVILFCCPIAVELRVPVLSVLSSVSIILVKTLIFHSSSEISKHDGIEAQGYGPEGEHAGAVSWGKWKKRVVLALSKASLSNIKLQSHHAGSPLPSFLIPVSSSL